MKLTAYTCVSVFIGFVTCQGTSARKPEICPANLFDAKRKLCHREGIGELDIQEGDELKLKCLGEGELQFSTETLIESLINQSDSQILTESGTYTFIRPKTIKEDTGWYACAEKDTEIKNDERTIDHPSEKISWIYVYVKPMNLLVNPFSVMNRSGEIESIIPGITAETVVIPCRPTDRNLAVNLYEGYNDESVPVEGNLSYDPRIGFIITNVTGGHHEMTFQCTTEKVSIYEVPSYKLDIKAVRAVSNADVKVEELRYIVLGENLTLSCNVTLPEGSFLTLNWITPDSVPKHRLNNSYDKYYSKQGLETHRSNLEIINVERSDTGTYICHASAGNDHAQSHTMVKIFAQEESSHVNWTVDGNHNSIIESENGNATWKISMEIYTKFTLEWYKGKERINDTVGDCHMEANCKLQKYARSSQVKKNQLLTDYFFVISNVSIGDSGNYSIRIITQNASQVIPLQLTVHAKPVTAILNTSPRIYKPGKTASFTCNTTGLPKPNVTWSFSKWGSEKNVENIEPLNETIKRGFSVLSRINVGVDAMGNLTCTTCNLLNCTNATVPIYVSDADAGFFGIDRRDKVVEGDHLTLTCTASVFNYTDKIGWNFNHSKAIVFNSERMKITKSRTNFTFRTTLGIRDVKKTDAHYLYFCKATNTAGGIDEANHTFSVLNAFPPNFTDAFVQKSEIYIQLPKNKKIVSKKLDCPVQGSPKPEVTWWKNGIPILPNDTSDHKIEHDNLTLTVEFVEGQSGNYSCIAKNRLGSKERYFNIIVEGKKDNTTLWVSLICVLILIIIIVITWMGIKVHRERVLRKELLEAGLTHFQDGALECLNPDLTVDEQAELLPYDKKWEFPRELLKLGKQLGSGAFGVVMKAEARGICVEGEVTTVAVKMVRRSADPSYMKALSSELKIMIHLGRHLNVVNLLGACTKTILTKRELYVIVEYCRFGNLHNYLQRHRASFINQIDPTTQKIDPNIGIELLVRSESVGSQNGARYRAFSTYRSISVSSSDSNTGTELIDYRQGLELGDVSMSPDGAVLSNNSVQPGWRSNYRGDYKDQNLQPICTQDLLCWAWQVSCGMKYLSDRNVLHGDLAARNILLAEDNIVKICDFGLAKNMYKDNNYKKKGDGPLPIKWMAVESIRDRMFSTHSDVWSFGIVLWEFFTLARTPYPGMEAEKQYDRLIEGYRMEKPEYATDEIYDFMLQCWKAKPSLRPSFPELAEKLGTLLNDGTKMHFLDMNTPYMDMNTQSMQDGQSDYLTMMSSPNHEYFDSPDTGSDYLPMSPVNRTGDATIFSPRPGAVGVHFDFPPPDENVPRNSDSADCKETGTVLGTESPKENVIDPVHQESVDSPNPGVERIQIEKESESSEDANNQHYINFKNLQSSDKPKDSDSNHDNMKYQKNNYNKELSPPTISTQNNYINMPAKNSCPLKDTVDNSFSNPSYVIMSTVEDAR